MPIPPISATYLNVQIARASAALEAAGAWDPTPTAMVCPYFTGVNLAFSYTRGGVGGAFEFQIEISPYSIAANAPAGAEEWVDEALYAAGAVVAGADTTSLVQRESQSYTTQGAAVETFIYALHFPIPVERLRILARETGAVGTPGTLQIQANFS